MTDTQRLSKLADTGNEAELARLLETGLDPNAEIDGTPLLFHVLRQPTLVALLADRGANLNVSNANKGYTPLIMALRQRWIDSAWLLLKRGASVEPVSFAGLPALVYAIEAERPDLTLAILERHRDRRDTLALLDHCIRRGLTNPTLWLARRTLRHRRAAEQAHRVWLRRHGKGQRRTGHQRAVLAFP